MGRKGTGGQGHRFTLVELLVVIAVIALLLGIVLPTLQAARGQEQSVHCKGNLGSWGRIWHTYVEDHDGRVARGNNVSDSHGQARISTILTDEH